MIFIYHLQLCTVHSHGKTNNKKKSPCAIKYNYKTNHNLKTVTLKQNTCNETYSPSFESIDRSTLGPQNIERTWIIFLIVITNTCLQIIRISPIRRRFILFTHFLCSRTQERWRSQSQYIITLVIFLTHSTHIFYINQCVMQRDKLGFHISLFQILNRKRRIKQEIKNLIRFTL